MEADKEANSDILAEYALQVIKLVMNVFSLFRVSEFQSWIPCQALSVMLMFT